MIWTSVKLYDFVIDAKTLGVKLAQVICRKSNLGKPIYGYTDMLYLISNIIFALEHAASDYTNDDYDSLYEMYIKILVQHTRYKGL